MSSLVGRARARADSKESDVDLDQEFHRLLLQIAGNRYLSDVYQRLADASLRLLYLTRCGMESPADQLNTFAEAEGALRARDDRALTRILREHASAFRDRISEALFRSDVPLSDDGRDSIARGGRQWKR
jgi:DNA-binding GntR family transcriptional regulator